MILFLSFCTKSGLPHDNFLAETCRNGVERFEPSGLVSSGNVSKDGEKYNHEPQVDILVPRNK